MRTQFHICALAAALALLSLGASRSAAAITAHLENPTGSELASGIGNIQGWAYATDAGDEIEPQIEIYIDGQFVMDVPCCSDRGDVQQLHPQAPLQTGFAGAFNFGSLNPGQHSLEAHVYSQNERAPAVLATTFTSDALGSFSFNKEFDWADAQADHCAPENALVNGEKRARIVCTGFTLTNGQGQTEHCSGEVELTWMASSQGFRVTKGCDLLN